MKINYKFPTNCIFHSDTSTKNIKIPYFLEQNENVDNADFVNSIPQLFQDFEFFLNPFDVDNLLKILNYISKKLRNLNKKLFIEIFSYGDYFLIQKLSDFVSMHETYSKNNNMIYIIFSIICEIIKFNEIDISTFENQSFFDCLLNFSIPKLIQNNSTASLIPALTLIKELLKDNPMTVSIFVEEGQFIEILINNFNTMIEKDQMETCQIFIQIINNYEIETNDSIISGESYDSLFDLDNENFANDQSFVLKNFIEEKMFYFEDQPFYILDLISESIKVGFISLTKLYIVNSDFIQNVILRSKDDKENSLIELNSLINLISTAFSSEIQKNISIEDKKEFFSHFQWSFFEPLLPYILFDSDEHDLLNCSIRFSLCNLFCNIFKKSEDLAERCKTEINLPDILLDLVVSCDVSFKVKEASIYALMNLVFVDPSLVFFTQDGTEQDITKNYLFVLIDFLESNADDNFLKSVINSILYIVIRSQYEIKSKIEKDPLPYDEKSKLVDNFIIRSLIECEDDLKEKIDIILSSIDMSNDECQKLLFTLQKELDLFFRMIDE